MHPEARAAQIDLVRDWAAQSGVPGWDRANASASRDTFRAAAAIKLTGPPPEVAEIRDIMIALPSGDRQARVYRPDPARELPTIIHVHGGGYVVGGLVEADPECRRLASSIGVNVVSITYRLAPEAPYPAGVEDVVHAIHAVRAGAAGFATGRTAVLGVSAGAGLAAAAVRRMLETRAEPIAALALLSPWLDLTLTLPSCALYGTGYFQELSQLVDFRALYLTNGMDPAHPDLSPARHPVRKDWPHTILFPAEMDPLADDSALFARRLSEAGVSYELHYAKRMLHGSHTWWQRVPSILPDLAWLDAAIGRALYGTSGKEP